MNEAANRLASHMSLRTYSLKEDSLFYFEKIALKASKKETLYLDSWREPYLSVRCYWVSYFRRPHFPPFLHAPI